MAPTRPTLAQLERELRRILTSDLTIEVAELRGNAAAHVVFGRPHRIVVDPFECSIKDGVIHELLHVARYDDFHAWGKLEEPMVEAVEAEMTRYVNDSKARRLWWRRTIERKLRETERGANV